MKKSQIKVFAAIMTSALLLTSPIYGNNYATDATVQSYNDRMADAARKQEELLSKLNNTWYEQANVWEELNLYDDLINTTMTKKELAEDYHDSLLLQIAAKEQEITDTSARIDTQEDAFLKRMATSYMEGDASYLELLLGAENLVDFLARIDRIQAIQESDRAIITQLTADREALIQAELALQKAKEEQLTVIADYEKAINESKDIYAAKDARIKQLQQNEAEYVASYNYYKQLEAELDKELEGYLAELQRKAQTVYVGGSMAWPLDPSASYYYSSEFGWRNLWGQPDNHLGLDIACAQNTKILAANGGTVLKSENHYSYGNYVLIDHGGGVATLYAHMTSRAVTAGETVSTGQVIGYVGMTGSASGHHLHFEVRVNGAVQQPRNYISGPNG